MSEKTKNRIAEVLALLAEVELRAEEGSFAHQIEANTLRAHIDELKSIDALEDAATGYEILDFRFSAPKFQAGSMPLSIVAKLSDEIRRLVGFAALRLTQGGMDKKRVPADLYQELDLCLAGLLPGSSRLVVAAAAHRDLLDDGIAKHSIDRIFRVLNAFDEGSEFLERMLDLGPYAAVRLRELLQIARSNDAELDLSWSYQGVVVERWEGKRETIKAVTDALEAIDITDSRTIIMVGLIELLSKRERIHLKGDSGEFFKIIFPKRMLNEVSELHLDQEVSLRCQVTKSENTITKERFTYYYLLAIERSSKSLDPDA